MSVDTDVLRRRETTVTLEAASTARAVRAKDKNFVEDDKPAVFLTMNGDWSTAMSKLPEVMAPVCWISDVELKSLVE